MDFESIETQEQFDAAIKSRLAREREKVRAEFANYEELKAIMACVRCRNWGKRHVRGA